jgi:hypothetical protein
MGSGKWCRRLQLLELKEDEIFIGAALDAVFKNTPQVVARILGTESHLGNWHEELLSHPELWFGGVKLCNFHQSTFRSKNSKDSVSIFSVPSHSRQVSAQVTGIQRFVLK